MPKTKHSLRYQIEIVATVLVSITFITAMWVFVFVSLSQASNSIITSWNKVQLSEINHIAELAEEKSSIEEFERFIVDQINHVYDYSNSSYGFLYRNGKVVFENNSETSRQFYGNTIRDMYGHYSYYGGSHLLEVIELMEKNLGGTDYFVKNEKVGNEYVTWKAMEYKENKYLIGLVTQERYILSEAGFYKVNYNSKFFVGICSLIVIVFASTFCYRSYSFYYSQISLEEENKYQKKLIRRNFNMISEMEQVIKKRSIEDFVTGLYSRKYFDEVIDNLNDKLFLPISICFMKIIGLRDARATMGIKAVDTVLKDMADICRDNITRNHLVCRYETDCFVILMANTSDEESAERIEIIESQIKADVLRDLPISIAWNFSTKFKVDEDLYQVVREAEEKLS